MMKGQVVVIGSGPGGYIAAIRAAQLGFSVIVVEKDDRFGGTCLNVGCIPSKSLLHDTLNLKTAVQDGKVMQDFELESLIRGGDHSQKVKAPPLISDYGSKDCVNLPSSTAVFRLQDKKPLQDLMQKKNEVVKSLTDGVASLFKKHKITAVKGEGHFVDPHHVQVGNETIEGDYFIIATGSEPSPLPFLPFDDKRVVSSTGALAFEEVPKHLVVIGGGVIGVELASVWSRLGAKVTVIEMLPEIVSTMDASISRGLLTLLQKQGITFKLSANAKEEKLEEADRILVATGRRPYTQNLGLEKLGITLTPKGFIAVNGRFQTLHGHIFAIGDVIEGPMLAHKAMEEGAVVAELIANQKSHIDYLSLPNVVYTFPEAASVGFTEAEAREKGRELMMGTCSMKAIGRARCNGHTDGFVKVIGDKATGRLLGIHILAEYASEMIGEAVVALKQKMTVEDLATAFHAHPTLSEGIKEASLGALGRSLNY